MPKKSPRKFDREFKLEAVRRLLAGETVRALSDELTVLRKDLYSWRKLFQAGNGSRRIAALSYLCTGLSIPALTSSSPTPSSR